jgi:hypothetical protein
MNNSFFELRDFFGTQWITGKRHVIKDLEESVETPVVIAMFDDIATVFLSNGELFEMKYEE